MNCARTYYKGRERFCSYARAHCQWGERERERERLRNSSIVFAGRQRKDGEKYRERDRVALEKNVLHLS